ncbi:MAG: DUF3592 domain-containing protein [Anaerolineales bacterium]|nr:DUF3592 domain-containing protein [Anaerolineales bacterium]
MPKKKYSINWENDEAQSFEVNGVTYESLDDVPDWKDRDKLAAMLHASSEDDFEEVKFDEKEFEELRKAADDPTMERWVLGGFTAIAVIMLLVTIVSIFSNIQKILKEESVPGIVVDVVKRRELINEENDIVRDFYYPVIEFVPSDGHKRSLQVSEGSDSPFYEKGDEITVLYDPEHPLDARIKSAGSNALMWVLPSITGILGIAFAGAVLVVRKVMSASA